MSIYVEVTTRVYAWAGRYYKLLSAPFRCGSHSHPEANALVVMMLLLITAPAIGQNLGPYTFTPIDTSPTIGAYYIGNLNDAGVVTFNRFDPGAEVVYVGSGGPLTKIADLNSNPGFEFINGPTIERNNITPTVVFRGVLSGGAGEGLYVGTGGALLPIIQGLDDVNNGGINDCGVVAYTKNANFSVWKYDGTSSGGPQLIDSIGGNTLGFGSFPMINDDTFGSGILSGTVSYMRVTSSDTEIELDSNLIKSTLATSCSGAPDINAQQPTINNAGVVVYSANTSGSQNLCTKSLSTVENMIANIPGIYNYDINVQGIVAFKAATGGPNYGIYTGNNLVTDKVVATGDILPDGSTVTDVYFGGINDDCQIAFYVYFQNGSTTGSKVWRANPSKCSGTPTNTVGIPYRYGDVMASIGVNAQGKPGAVDEFQPNGSLVQTLINGSGAPITKGVTFDVAGNLYVANFGTGTVSKFNASGQLLTATFLKPSSHGQNSVESIRAVGVNPSLSDLKLYTGGPSAPIVIEWDSSGNFLRAISVAPGGPTGGTDWIDFIQPGILVYSGEGHAIKAYDIVANKQLTDVISNLPGSSDYQFRIVHPPDYCGTPGCTLPDPYILVANTNQAVLVDASSWPGSPGTVTKTYALSGVTQDFALAVDPDGKGFWTGDLQSNKVWHVNICTGKTDVSWLTNGHQVLGGLSVWGGVGHIW
jgi:hypothetical protein